MSRAFVKEGEDRPERPPPRPVSDRPNRVTRNGLKLLNAALARAREAGDDRNVAYFEDRIAGAIVVTAHEGDPATVAFGSAVTVREAGGAAVRWQIVGEDEADPAHGTIAWASPYAAALMGHRCGDRVVVRRPAGSTAVVIEKVEALK